MHTLLYLSEGDDIIYGRRITSVNIDNCKLTLELSWGAHCSRRWQTGQQAESLQNWGKMNEELRLRRGLPLVAIPSMSKRTVNFIRITKLKFVLHSYHLKLIDYWRLQCNTTSSIFCQHESNRYNFIIPIR